MKVSTDALCSSLAFLNRSQLIAVEEVNQLFSRVVQKHFPEFPLSLSLNEEWLFVVESQEVYCQMLTDKQVCL